MSMIQKFYDGNFINFTMLLKMAIFSGKGTNWSKTQAGSTAR
jgi:hypothetical protein